jgi:thymidine kinase
MKTYNAFEYCPKGLKMSAKVHFRFGAMGSSKTASALMLNYNFREKGMIPLLAKPEADTRTTKMWSRIGLEANCTTLENVCEMSYNELSGYDCIIVDEVQFANEDQVEFLVGIADHLNIPVFLYGLKTDFRGRLFDGSKRILELADSIEEIETTCWCGAAARFSARVDKEGNMIRQGEIIDNGEVENRPKYVALCRKHFFAGRTGNIGKDL